MKLATILLLLHLAAPASIPIEATETGVAGTALSATPRTKRIDMEAGYPTNQLSWTLTITPGTSATVVVKCYESETGAANTWAQITKCEGSAAAGCDPDTRTYTLANFDTNAAGKKVIASRWGVKKKWALCTADDPADGNGTLVLTGTRTWQ